MPTERVYPGGTEMKRKVLISIVAGILIACANIAVGCEYKPGETKFLDYALCRYGEDGIEVVALPADSTWENCVYLLEAFRPPKLLAVTKMQDGKEIASINNRAQIGNPCYLTKQYCDKALDTAQQ